LFEIPIVSVEKANAVSPPGSGRSLYNIEYKKEKVNKLIDKPPTNTDNVIAVNLGALNNNRNEYFISINTDMAIS
jgi:hypothetical protein